MKIISRAEFLKLPAGTLYQEYEPQWFNSLSVFEGPFGTNDFVSEPITDPPFEEVESSEQLSDLLYNAPKNKQSMPLAYGRSSVRDGCFMDDQQYAVYEKQDVARLIAFLQEQQRRAY